MNSEQRAIIALAEKEGVSPIEKDARLIVHGMVNATRDQMRKYQVGYDKMGEAQQDAVIGDLTKAYEDLAITIARALASASTPAVVMTCKDLKVSNGMFTATVDSDQTHYNDLISKVQDKGEIMAVLYERQYRDGMETIQADRDQKSLPLDDEEPTKPKSKRASAGTGSATSAANLAKKATELPPKLLQDARDFITNQQVCTVSGIQNGLKIGALKAVAVLDQMVAEGIVSFVGDSKSGEYQLVRSAPAVTPTPGEGSAEDALDFSSADGLSFDGDMELDNEPSGNTGDILTDDLYAKIKEFVVKKGKFSVGSVLISLDIADDIIVEEAARRMEEEGILTEENDAGIRSLVA